jgi:hypothetical protein
MQHLSMQEKTMAMIPSMRQEMLYAGPATAADHRLKVQQQDRERAALRASELATQTSPARGAEERIRIWERLHALRLPSTAAHALVAIVAKQTSLTVGEVQAEQRRRSAGPARAEAPAPEAADRTI